MLNRVSTSVVGRRLAQAVIDACLVALAYLLAFVLRFDPSIPERYSDLLTASIWFVVAGKIVIFWANGLYHKLWRFVDAKDFEAIVRAVVMASAARSAARSRARARARC